MQVALGAENYDLRQKDPRSASRPRMAFDAGTATRLNLGRLFVTIDELEDTGSVECKFDNSDEDRLGWTRKMVRITEEGYRCRDRRDATDFEMEPATT